jgi:hypothetical protein
MVDGVKFNGSVGSQFGKNNVKSSAQVSNSNKIDGAKFMKLVASGRVSRPIGKISSTARIVRQLDAGASAKAPRSMHDTLYSAGKRSDAVTAPTPTPTPLTERSARIISSDELQEQLPKILSS